MKLTKFIYKNAGHFFLAILLASIVVFGGRYYLRVAGGEGGYMPLATFHAWTAGLWCVLLLVQGYLIRQQKTGLHGALGKAGILLVPLVAFSILWISLDVLRFDGLREGAIYILAVRVFLFLYFLGFLVVALANTGRPDVHARWMICSASILLDPIISRVSAFLHPVPWTTGFHQLVAFSVMDSLILGLAVADWRQGRRDVFPIALLLMLAGQAATLLIWTTPAFRWFASWFSKLPLPVGY